MLVRLRKLGPVFVLTVLVPTLLAAVYFGLFANDLYTSQSSFVVRSPTKGNVSPLGLVLSGGTLTGSSEESSAVVEFVRSHDALGRVNADGLVSRAYGAERASWFDRFGGLWGRDSREKLYRYFTKKVTIEHDVTTQVTHLSVNAFDPKDAHAINERLLRQSELLVNRLSERARGDAIAVAQGEVDAAKEKVRSAAGALSRFRNRSGIIDPEKEAEVRLQMVSKLQDQLIGARTQLLQMQTYTPRASQIPFLKVQVRSLEAEIARQTSGIAGSSASLSANAARYQELALDTQLAEKQLAASLASLEEAAAESRRKRAYVERISGPSLPDDAMEPRRLRGILATFLLGLLAWGVLSTLIVGIREHRD
jgi:ABC-2 type transport system permease protein/capsular polysaccharide transport system permease protein